MTDLYCTYVLFHDTFQDTEPRKAVPHTGDQACRKSARTGTIGGDKLPGTGGTSAVTVKVCLTVHALALGDGAPS